jgi:hypothetical protein
MKSTYFRYSVLFILGASLNGFAQVKPDEKKPEPPKEGLKEEIEVVRPYMPVLADVSKIRRSPDLNSNKPFKPNLSYSILDKRLELNSDLRQLQAEELNQAPAAPLKNNYAKLGAGNLGTALAEAYINNGADEALQAGGYFKHVNQSGSLNQQNISRQELGVFGKSIQERITLNGEIGYDRLSTYFYGFNPANTLANPDPKSQRYGTLNLRGELLKNFQEDSEADYAAKLDAYFLRNNNDAKESSYTLSGFFNKIWNQFNVGANSSIDFTSSKQASELSNNLIRINPYLKLQGKNYKLSLGLNLVKEFGTDSRTNIFPAVIGELPIVPGYATIFGGYTGDVLKSTIRNFAQENPFLAQNITIKNAVEKSNIYGGIKGNAGAGFGFKAMVFLKTIEDLPLFVNNQTNLERFDLIYDAGNSTTFGFEGELNVRTSETLNLSGRLQLNEYNTKTEEEAWFKPKFRLFSNAHLSISKKFLLDAELVLNGDTKALTFGSTPEERQITNISSYADLSVGAEYILKQKFGIFLRANNIFGNEYQRFLYYPNLGLNILGGLNYSF